MDRSGVKNKLHAELLETIACYSCALRRTDERYLLYFSLESDSQSELLVNATDGTSCWRGPLIANSNSTSSNNKSADCDQVASAWLRVIRNDTFEVVRQPMGQNHHHHHYSSSTAQRDQANESSLEVRVIGSSSARETCAPSLRLTQFTSRSASNGSIKQLLFTLFDKFNALRSRAAADSESGVGARRLATVDEGVALATSSASAGRGGGVGIVRSASSDALRKYSISSGGAGVSLSALRKSSASSGALSLLNAHGVKKRRVPKGVEFDEDDEESDSENGESRSQANDQSKQAPSRKLPN